MADETSLCRHMWVRHKNKGDTIQVVLTFCTHHVSTWSTTCETSLHSVHRLFQRSKLWQNEKSKHVSEEKITKSVRKQRKHKRDTMTRSSILPNEHNTCFSTTRALFVRHAWLEYCLRSWFVECDRKNELQKAGESKQNKRKRIICHMCGYLFQIFLKSHLVFYYS